MDTERAMPVSHDPPSSQQREEFSLEESIKYQIAQLPSLIPFPSKPWKENFSLFSLPVPSFETRRGVTAPGGPPKCDVLVWKFDPRATWNGASVVFKEFGLGDNHDLQKIQPPTRSASGGEVPERLPNEDGAPSCAACGGQTRVGREWIFGLNGSQDDTLFSLAAYQFCRDVDLVDGQPDDALDEPRQRLARCFVTKFRARWDTESSRNLWGTSDESWARSGMFNMSCWEDLVFQYHMRVFTTIPRRSNTRPGPGLTRSSGKLSVGADTTSSRGLPIVELRYSVGVKTTWKLDHPVFTLVTLADSTLSQLGNLGELSDAHVLAGTRQPLRGTGIAAFAFRIHSLLPQWEDHWSRLIDDVGKALTSNADLDTILSHSRRRRIMIDGSDLELSEFYFAIIQTLRIAADWIQESMDDLRSTFGDIERLYFSKAPPRDFPTFLPSEQPSRNLTHEIFKENSDSVITKQRQIGTGLLARISKLQEETQSLRDGLFNATSVNEATKSTQLNHYILVFTVVTVFYLPLSFITALFALGFFNLEDDPKQTRWFIITSVVVACATYVSSWLLIWVVQHPEQTRAAPRLFFRLFTRPATFPRERRDTLEK